MSRTDRDDWAYGGDPASGDWPPPGRPTADERWHGGVPARRRLRDRLAGALIRLMSRRSR